MTAQTTRVRAFTPVRTAVCVQTSFTGFLLWIVWTTLFAIIAVSFGHLVSPLAEGSGLPQLKSILGGTPISGYFSWRVLVAKLLGTFAAQVAGLSLGKEVRPLRCLLWVCVVWFCVVRLCVCAAFVC